MQPDTDTWQPRPDQLLDRVRERARTLLGAEKVALGRQADDARQATMVSVIAIQSRAIDDLTAACATLHERAETDATALAAAAARRVEDLAAHDKQAAGLRAELDAAVSRLAECHATLQAAEGRLAERDATVAALEHHLRELLGSTSWRLTRPLRSIRQRINPL